MNVLENKHVYRSYEILDTVSAGIVLSGNEVKSLRNHHGSLNDAFVVSDNGTLTLVKAFIPPYQVKNTPASYDPYQARTLLLNKKEIMMWARKKTESGLTIVPIKMYTENRKIKVLLGLAKGKKKHDKREDIKKRDADREINRLLKH